MTASNIKRIQPRKLANAAESIRHVFIRNLVLSCSIGIHGHEKAQEQRVRINLDLAVFEDGMVIDDDIHNVICYEKLATGAEEIAQGKHVNLVETLAENLADMCLKDRLVRSVRVRVEKLDIMDNAESVGVEIERYNSKV